MRETAKRGRAASWRSPGGDIAARQARRSDGSCNSRRNNVPASESWSTLDDLLVRRQVPGSRRDDGSKTDSEDPVEPAHQQPPFTPDGCTGSTPSRQSPFARESNASSASNGRVSDAAS